MHQMWLWEKHYFHWQIVKGYEEEIYQEEKWLPGIEEQGKWLVKLKWSWEMDEEAKNLEARNKNRNQRKDWRHRNLILQMITKDVLDLVDKHLLEIREQTAT